MVPEKALKKLFAQFAEVIEKVERGEFKEGEIPADLKEKLARTKEQLALFKEATEEALQTAGIDTEKLDTAIARPKESQLNASEQDLLERANFVRKALDDLRGVYAMRSAIIKKGKKEEKGTGKERKKKFKRLGGGNWMPM